MNKLPIEFEKPLYLNFREFFADVAYRYGDNDAFILKHKVKKDINYTSISFNTLSSQVKALGTSLLNMGYKNKKIAIIGENSYNWLLAYYSALSTSCISVPLDKGLPYEETLSSLIRSEASLIFFDKGHLDEINKIKEGKQTSLDLYISIDEIPGFTHIDELLSNGFKLLEDGDTSYEDNVIDENESTILLFTSGTTSMSKIVCLSQKNILSNIYALQSSEHIFENDRNLAFLPFHHTFGSTGSILMVACGVSTAFCDGLKYLSKNLIEYKISVFFCVPLLIESIYKKVMIKIKKEGKEKTFNLGMKLSKFLLKFNIDIRRKIFSSIHDQMGGHLRLLISGASAIDKKALECFLDLGITAVQGYGLTETSPVLSAENNNNIRVGSVGKPMCNVDIKINNPDQDGVGEVFAKGPNIMAGYYENPEENEKVFVDGWFNTGDLGYIDKDGYIFLRGRSKSVIILKNGKNIYPEEIETLIANLPYVAESMVFPIPKKQDPSDLIVGVKLVYNPEYIKDVYGDMTTEALENMVELDIDKINETMPQYKHIKRIIVTDKEMIKTSTRKVKRHEEIKEILKTL